MPPKRSSTRRAAVVAAAASTPSRRASTRATRHTKTPTPPQPSDPSEDDENQPQPQSNDEAEASADVDADDGAQEVDEAEASEAASERQILSIPKRRPGRPPKPRPFGWDTPDVDGGDASESGTPVRSGRGRGRGRGGGRGGPRGRGRRGGAVPVTKPPVDDEGNEMEVIDDEVVQPEHVEGEKKVDKNGVLQDGREYRVRTFNIVGREERLYMLSTEPARCMGYRDSYLFFAKHKHLYKIILGDEEKKDLIERDILPHSYKGRSIGVVTARSVYREFGSRIVVGGKKIVDDYNPDEARARGDVEGALADPYDRMPEKGQGYNRNQYVAWHGASSVYHSNAPMGAMPPGGFVAKKRGAITSANWMYEHAREASRFNSSLSLMRKGVHDGVYDPHSNVMCYPRIMQPTRAVWEQVEEPKEEPPVKKRKIEQVNGTAKLTNGIQTDDHGEAVDTSKDKTNNGSSLLQPSSYLRRNYVIVDTGMLTPQSNAWASPDAGKRLPQHHSADNAYDFDTIADAGFWSSGPPRVSDDILATFPPDARTAYLRERGLQSQWQNLWSDNPAVQRPKIGIASMAGAG